MAEPEIDPASAAEVELIRQVYAHPEARKYIEEAVHIKYPNANLPGRSQRVLVAEVDKRVSEREAKLDTKIADFEKKQEREATKKQLREAGYAEEQIAGIEKLMADEGLNVANASVVYQARTYVAPPRTPSGGGGSMRPDAYRRGAHSDYFRGIFDGDFHTPGQDWLHDKIDAITNDFANGQGKKWDDPNYWPGSPNFPAQVK